MREACSIALVLVLAASSLGQIDLDTKPDDAQSAKGGAGAKGDKGAQGDKGAKGDKGAEGGKTSAKQAAGKQASADKNGDNSAGKGQQKAAKQPAAAGKQADDFAEKKESGEEQLSDFQKIMSSGLMGFMLEGGLFMWPILLVGIVAAGVIIERYRSLSMLNTDTEEVRGEVQALLERDEIEAAIRRCDDEQGPVPAILSTGLRKYLLLRRLDYDAGRIEEQVVKAMEDYNVHVVAALERHLPVLATISSVAPMLGFLGTVSGMITSFKDIIARIAEANIVVVAAGGISEALLTTCFGLIVGIPAFIAYNYFTSVINRYVLDVEESATELIEGVTMRLALEDSAATDSAEVVV